LHEGDALAQRLNSTRTLAPVFSNRVDRVSESYSPARPVFVQKDAVSGTPDRDRAGTSHVERKNGTPRQRCERLTRLTYALTKK
jgi:IS1 family transposase